MTPETEERISQQLTTLNELVRHLATKAELHQELHALTWRFLGLTVAQTGLILGAMYYMLTHVHSA
jgi:hypothetical protein